MTDLEQEYSPSSRVGGSAQPFIDDYRSRSRAARDRLGPRVEVLDGGTLFVDAAPAAPLVVYIHGGYWQALGAEESLYLAPGALAMGWSFAAIEYTIAPTGTLPQMIDECREALARLAVHLPNRSMVLAGHSAGAHLAAMVSLAAAPPVPLDRVVLISGVYDLRPIVHTSVNDPIGLDEGEAEGISPALLPVIGARDILVTWGDNETDAFKAQSHVYAARLRASGRSVVEQELPDRHHFDIVDDLVDPSSPLGSFVVGRARRT